MVRKSTNTSTGPHVQGLFGYHACSSNPLYANIQECMWDALNSCTLSWEEIACTHTHTHTHTHIHKCTHVQANTQTHTHTHFEACKACQKPLQRLLLLHICCASMGGWCAVENIAGCIASVHLMMKKTF